MKIKGIQNLCFIKLAIFMLFFLLFLCYFHASLTLCYLVKVSLTIELGSMRDLRSGDDTLGCNDWHVLVITEHAFIWNTTSHHVKYVHGINCVIVLKYHLDTNISGDDFSLQKTAISLTLRWVIEC